MRVLVVTAVPAEHDAVLAGVAAAAPAGAGFVILPGGVGPAASAATTAAALSGGEPGGGYDLAISAGIGGGFAGVVGVEGIVVASSIVAADLGVRTPEGFTDVAELGFGRVAHRPPESLAREVAGAAGAVLGPVLTVSTVTGSAERARELADRHPGVAAEAMEGFGVAEAADRHGVPVLEIRAVSNAVGPRDRTAWRIVEALGALTAAFTRIAPVLTAWAGDPAGGTD